MNLKKQVDTIKNNVDKINEIMSQLWEQGVEVRIAYREPDSANKVPRIELWRATHHVDLLKTNEPNE
jgi:hypothetical protein